MPLVALLVLSQLGIGMSVAALLVPNSWPLMLMAPLAGGLAIVAGSLHLGQPLKAWRSFLGWRTSWFSREVIAMGFYAFFAVVAGAAAFSQATLAFGNFLKLAAAIIGLLTVTCSAMIYVATRREFWSAAQCFSKFFGTLFVLGSAAALTTLVLGGASGMARTAATLTLALAILFKLGFEQRIFRHLVDREALAQTPLNKTARLLDGKLRPFVQRRIGCAVVGGVLLPAIVLMEVAADPAAVGGLAIASLALCFAGEVIERYLFFTVVVAQKMPGGIGA